MKPISPFLHGVLDYGTCAFFALAPSLFGLTGAYATVCYLLAGGYLVISLLTNMPLGAIKAIPFPIHGKLELVSGPAFIAAPWLFGFANENPTARNLFIGAGIVFLIVYFLTDWYAQSRTAGTTIDGSGVHSAAR